MMLIGQLHRALHLSQPHVEPMMNIAQLNQPQTAEFRRQVGQVDSLVGHLNPMAASRLGFANGHRN
jgi:hypothetical protein